MDNSLFQQYSLDLLINKLKCDHENQRSYLQQFKNNKKQNYISDELAKIKLENELQLQTNQQISNKLNNIYQKKRQYQENNIKRNQEQICYIERQKQQKRKLLVRKAEQWLKEFDDTSDEGFWFEKFSTFYPSKLEAALDYIAALDEIY